MRGTNRARTWYNQVTMPYYCPSRVRRIAKWAALAVFGLLAIAFVANMLWLFEYYTRQTGLHAPRGGVALVVRKNMTEEYWLFDQIRWWPGIAESSAFRVLIIPSWVLLSAAAFCTALLWRRDRTVRAGLRLIRNMVRSSGGDFLTVAGRMVVAVSFLVFLATAALWGESFISVWSRFPTARVAPDLAVDVWLTPYMARTHARAPGTATGWLAHIPLNGEDRIYLHACAGLLTAGHFSALADPDDEFTMPPGAARYSATRATLEIERSLGPFSYERYATCERWSTTSCGLGMIPSLTAEDHGALQSANARVRSVQLPLWAPVALSAACPSYAFICGPLRRYRRRRKGLCLTCGYDLTGNESGRCPECGEAR
ncbi:MAG: hypothetical protein GY842_27135 [bacterium]|nr:hypothetical protein [bacterium]